MRVVKPYIYTMYKIRVGLFCMFTSCCVVVVTETCPKISSLWLKREDKVV